jgi:N-acetyl-anhydromuramyl-L-alanine amidase AmpD
VVEPDGTIWQLADASLRCAHAGTANGWSIGVEIVNPALTRQQQGDARRQVVVENIHGRDVVATTFTAEQMHATLVLTEALCRAYGLPLVVPLNETADVASTVLPGPLLAHWRGVLGHLHLKAAKRDPGLAVLRAISALGPRTIIGLDGAAQ